MSKLLPTTSHKRFSKFHSSTTSFSRKRLLLFALLFGLVGGYILLRTFASPNPNLPGDLNGDNTVGITDLSILLSNYNTTNPTADINLDGTVNILDLSILLSHWGQSYSASTLKIGETNILTNFDNGNANLLVAQSAVLSQTATLQSLSFYVQSAAGNLRLGVYNATGPGGGPGAKIAETAEITPVTGWNTANVTAPISLAVGTYWLAYLPSSSSLAFVNGTDSSSSGRYYSYTYGSMPGTFSTSPSTFAAHWSFYATLNTSGTNPPPPPPPPPSGSALKWKPPGWNGGDPKNPASFPGYLVVDAPQGPGTLNLDNTKDYYIRLGHPTWSSNASGTGFSALDINGGRNRVIIGGQITTHSTNTYDDIRDLVIDGGDPAGITHIEGVLFDDSTNAITIRSPQTIQMENIRVSNNHVFQDDFTSGGVHPDLVQTWGSPGTFRTDHFTGYSDYTGLSVLLTPNPASWSRYNVDIHGLPPQTNSVHAGVPLLGGNFVYFGDSMVTTYTGQNLWMETGYYDASYQRKLDDVIGYGQTCPPYELHPGPGLSGSTYTSSNPCTGGSGGSSNPADLGRRQGDFMTFSRVPLLTGETWSWGKPTTTNGADSNGNFVSATLPGLNYVSPGYQ